VTDLKSTFLKAPRKSPDATCSAVQADTPLRYVTAFKLSIGERHEKARLPCVVLIGAPQKAGERLDDDLFILGEKLKPQAPRLTRSLQKAQGALQRCSAAGHFARAYVTGCKSTIGECHGKTKAACHVSCRPALPKSTGAPRRQPFHFGQTSNKEAPDTPLRYVTGFNII
jgi:hypothetical protein